MADALYVNGTQVHPSASPFSFGVCNVVGLDWGTPDSETFLDPVPLADGMAFRGHVTKERRFTVVLSVSDCGSYAKGQDVWQQILTLIDTGNGLVNFRYVRNDGAGGTIDRRLMAIVDGQPAWAWNPSGGGDGLRPGGNVVVTLPCLAPFPWFRDTDYDEVFITPSGTTAAGVTFSRPGQLGCGVEVKASTAGALTGITLNDGLRTMALTATFTGTPKGVDWFHTDPTSATVDTGVTVGVPASISLHTSTAVITCTPAGSSSAQHTVRLRFFPTWRTP